MKQWTLRIMPIAEQQLKLISDRRIQKVLRGRLRRLEYEPELQGKPLIDELASYRSVRAVGQRYRIIYRVDGEQVTVLVVTSGIRKDGDKKDVYQLAKKLIRLGLLDIE